MVYQLRSEGDYKPYLSDDLVFGAKTSDSPTRKLLTTETAGKTTTAAEKCEIVDFMLETIAQYCPKIPHNDIIRDCQSLAEVWQVVRLHSNIETTGALLNEVWNITRLPSETPQALYSRIKQAYDDNLIRKETLKYKDKKLDADEVLSPTLHCTIILQWLQILHPKLRNLVTQRFCTELRHSTYAAIWPEISRSVNSLLTELSEDGTVCRYDPPHHTSRSRGSYSRPPYTQPQRSTHPQQSSRST